MQADKRLGEWASYEEEEEEEEEPVSLSPPFPLADTRLPICPCASNPALLFFFITLKPKVE